MPEHGFAREVCRRAGGAIALTSANLSGQSSPLEVEEFQQLWPACATVFDGGRIGENAPHGSLMGGSHRGGSCIVDLTPPGGFRILRRGHELAAQAAVQLLAAHGLRQIENDDGTF